MPLQYAYEVPTGFTGNYWVARNVDMGLIPSQGFDFIRGDMLLYKDKQAFDEGKAPMFSRAFNLTGIENPVNPVGNAAGLVTLFYQAIIANDSFFRTAVEVG